MSELNKKVVSATKWSSITEIAAKLVAPISTIFLARLLTPSAFGVLVTVTMVISFTEIFTDAGFQKYLIQHEFEDEKTLYKSTNVAFWSNLTLSILIWLIIILFAEPIARLVGNEGKGAVIAVACCCIPLEAFSSIQMALYKRNLDFKTLFLVRIVGVLIPLIVTIPLAYITRSYWSLVIGMIALNLSNAIILTIKSKWKPKLEYQFSLFKEMFSFTSWSLIEAISIWLTTYADIFIVGHLLNDYYLGIYRTSMSTVGQFTGIIISATTPILFSSLSRLQNDRTEFENMFFKFQKTVGFLIIPIGVGIFLFSDLITELLLGSQWKAAAHFMGLWGLTTSISVVLSHYCSEVYRSLGRPKLSVIAQWCHIVVLVPTVWISIQYGFEILCDARALVRLQLILTNLILMYWFVKVSPWAMIQNILPELFAAGCMAGVYYLLPHTSSLSISLVYVAICAISYIFVVMLFPKERHIALNIKKLIKR